RCHYCDFAIHVRKRIPHERYAEAVLRELELRAPLFAGRELVSIYFGGGTPGLWHPDCVARVARAVAERFDAQLDSLEVSLEANPGQLDRTGLRALHDAGVNRLSLGIQSFTRRHLHRLGRDHDEEEGRRAITDARAEGFENLSLDLMFGLSEQTLTELDYD